MKKTIAILFVILSIFFFKYQPTTFIMADSVYYGRAIENGIYIYSSPTILDDKSNRIFEIPKTYFVQLLGDENDLFYKASYNSIYGYVLKSEVSCINQTPQNAYAININFRVFTPSGANLRSSPNESKGATNLITSIPFLETNLVYYGICEGEEAISYKGNIWYYCKYITQNQEYYGYVYSPLCDLLTPINENTEKFEYVTPNFSVPDKNGDDPDKYLSISTPWQIIIIVLISLPCIFIIYFLFKQTKIAMQQPKKSNSVKMKKKKKKISRLKHSDYYELDSDYFD